MNLVQEVGEGEQILRAQPGTPSTHPDERVGKFQVSPLDREGLEALRGSVEPHPSISPRLAGCYDIEGASAEGMERVRHPESPMGSDRDRAIDGLAQQDDRKLPRPPQDGLPLDGASPAVCGDPGSPGDVTAPLQRRAAALLVELSHAQGVREEDEGEA